MSKLSRLAGLAAVVLLAALFPADVESDFGGIDIGRTATTITITAVFILAAIYITRAVLDYDQRSGAAAAARRSVEIETAAEMVAAAVQEQLTGIVTTAIADAM